MSRDRTVRVLDLLTGALVSNFADVDELEGGGITADGLTSFAFGSRRVAHFHTLATGDLQQHLALPSTAPATGGLESAAISRDGRLVAAGGRDGALQFWDPRTAKLFVSLQSQAQSAVTTMSFSGDGKQLVTGTRDGTVELWTPGESPKPRFLLRCGTGTEAVAFSADGRRIAAACDDNSTRVIELGTDTGGRFQFGLVQGDIHYVVVERDGHHAVEWSWVGVDENDEAAGRGWAVVNGDKLEGRIFIHRGDHSAFLARRSAKTR